MIRIEIWASGGGTNADAIAQYFYNHPTICIASLGCNRSEAGAFEIAKKHSIPSVYWSKEDWNSTEILKQLAARKIDYIVMAGFLKLVPAAVTQYFDGRIINIHPSLLPLYGGKDMYGEHVHQAVLKAREYFSGITIHEANEDFDKGKIIAQYTIPLSPGNETLVSIKQRIQMLEHKHFAPTIAAWIASKTRE